MKRTKKSPEIENFLLKGALAKRGLEIEDGAILLGVRPETLKRWLVFKGRPPKISQRLEKRLCALTGKPAEDILPREMFAMGRNVKFKKSDLGDISDSILRTLSGTHPLANLNPEVALQQRERLSALLEALQELPYSHQNALFRYMAGEPDEEYSRTIHTTVTEVRVRRSRGLDKLRSMFLANPDRFS